MDSELKTLEENHTWDVVLLPSGKKALPCKWVYKAKHHANGTVERLKTKLVIRGDVQREGINYTETFSLVVKMTTIRCLLSIAVKKGWSISQFDVGNAFYMGSCRKRHGDFKRAGWNYYHSKEITTDLLVEIDCSTLPPVSSPLDPSSKLVANSGAPLSDASLYRRLVGKLNYLTHMRPDLSFAILILSQFMKHPYIGHFTAALRVFCYLHSNPSQGLFLNAQTFFDLLAFSDADWGSCCDSRRSVSGFFIGLGGSPVS
ncbi:PREDICTED: uncharacterized protein LOC109231478 [Nicotiana attenuata]|uniref:uncharacterized protein LOC109231478 n=1 Tax=Nicotiana attenuata TaxID=49451 RepID=UPI000904DEA3|nr:PREDICTED: uncharacterized protein LOC109231478 [Nicotiana attenuata]